MVVGHRFRSAEIIVDVWAPKNPNDEPAAILLNRVRAAKTTKPKPKRGRRTRYMAPQKQVDLPIAA